MSDLDLSRTAVEKDTRIYSAELWARLVKAATNFACSQCGGRDDVQATYIKPPSLGGRNVLDNGTALCVLCRSKPFMNSGKVRFNFSIPSDLNTDLNKYCERSGRSINDVVKQLLADFLYDTDYSLNGFHEDATKDTDRRSIPVLRPVYEEFVKKCGVIKKSPPDVMKSMLYKYLKNFQGGDQ